MNCQVNMISAPMVRCAIYARRAITKRGAVTPATQELRCRAAAEQHPEWFVLDEHVYIDEGDSGTKERRRPGISELLANATSLPRPFDCLVVADLACLGPDFQDVHRVLDELTSNDVYVHFVSLDNDSRNSGFIVTAAFMKQLLDPNYVLSSTEARMMLSDECCG